MKIDLGCYYFPNYHSGDPRNDLQHGCGWSEWALVRRAEPRFGGHRQPRTPLWGETDEKNPAEMARKTATAARHGIDHFIFDWYYYDDGPFLERALDQGFLQAPNRGKFRFSLMWANHDWTDIHPATRFGRPVLYPGKVSRATFEKIIAKTIRDYFLCDDYYRIDGKPYFSIYDLSSLLASFGSVAATRRALDDFRRACRAAGLPGLHLNAVAWGVPLLPGEKVPGDLPAIIRELGFDSVTSYVWIHHVALTHHTTDYTAVLSAYLDHWQRMLADYDIDYYPNISCGWDSTPRTIPSEVWDWQGGAYPYGNVITGNTPEAFAAACRQIRDRLDELPLRHRMITINSWNEWTEGSYLEPDTENQYRYLQALQQVFQE